ncbi:peptidase inhibitor family I36 protein [Lentzea sp. CC55]|uniref:peptidase inhibitor family I36 protein n=1 Tax=Lentzea sp. CC55 TaxID=2884909 RepID=UPI001F19229E|nr:peptidase inhibitor family I36 protein [Lentzea sp. CC55]MCG8927593.1 peptidase inhibitor family I36 protein [Lentzea sp. CC55]
MKKIASVLAAVGVAGVSLVAAEGVANAACTYDHACMYSASDYKGLKRDDGYSRPNWGQVTYNGTSIALYRGDGSQQNVSSMENRDENSYIAVYYNSNYAGPCFRIRPNGKVPNFQSVKLPNGDANDRMNSHKFNPSNCQTGTIYG